MSRVDELSKITLSKLQKNRYCKMYVYSLKTHVWKCLKRRMSSLEPRVSVGSGGPPTVSFGDVFFLNPVERVWLWLY